MFCVFFFALLPTVQFNIVTLHSSPQGSDTRLMLTLTPVSSLALLPTGSTGSKKSVWSTLNTINRSFLKSPYKFFFCLKPSLSKCVYGLFPDGHGK